MGFHSNEASYHDLATSRTTVLGSNRIGNRDRNFVGTLKHEVFIYFTFIYFF